MNKIRNLSLLCALLALATPQVGMSTVFFNDDFSAGSTLNSLTPAAPTANSTAYQVISGKSWTVTNITSGHLTFGIAPTTSGTCEVQALFTNTPIALSQAGDFLRMTVVFTDTIGVLTGNGTLGFGMYNSGQVQPIAGGLNGTATSGTSAHTTDGAAHWRGYVALLGYTNLLASRIQTRDSQTTGTLTDNCQDLVSQGSGSLSYAFPGATTLGSSTNTPVLASNQTYTVVVTMTSVTNGIVAITNQLYLGSSTNGIFMAQYGATNTSANYMGSAFDGLAVGWRATANAAPWNIDITSLKVDGAISAVAPPTILSQPISASVATNGSCPFKITVDGVNPTYQWRRNGANLVDGPNISGSTTPTLIINAAGTADEVSGANGYYCVVTNLGGSTNSVTNSLTLIPATNLLWSGSSSHWDITNAVSWKDPLNQDIVFSYGDSVTFDDTGFGNASVSLDDSYLSAPTVTINNINVAYNFAGNGAIAGPGKLIVAGQNLLTINNVNTYTGGTIISNEFAYLVLNNWKGLGTGPVTLAKAGGIMEVKSTAGSQAGGLDGAIVVADDFKIILDGTGAYAGVFNGTLSGTVEKTLTIDAGIPTNTVRVRFYAAPMTNDARLVLNNSLVELAPYHSTSNQFYNGVISGPGGLIPRAGGTTILNATNTYSGFTTPTTGTLGLGCNSQGGVGSVTGGPIGTGILNLTPELPNPTGSGTVLAYGGARTIANALQYGTNNLTLIVGGANDLTFLAPLNLCGTNDPVGAITNRTITVNNTALTTFSGVISDTTNGVSAHYGLTKNGTNILVLSNTETYTGPTAVSAGTLQVNGALNALSLVTANTNGTLGGTGTINGAVTIDLGGALAPGASIGTLTINSNLTVNGNLRIELDKSLAPGQSNDVVFATGNITSGGAGTIYVTNLGPNLVVGDTFRLFTNGKTVTGGNTMPVIGGKVAWNNTLATDGSISVSAFILPVITSSSLSGTNLVFSGTGGAQGVPYNVLSQTNAAAPLSTWTPIATNTFTAGGAFSVTTPIRPGVPARFYILNVP